MDVERRRSARVPFSKAEAAVLQVGDREIFVQIVNISANGALLAMLELPSVSTFSQDCDGSVVLSMNLDQSVVHTKARVIRRTPGFLAVEFGDALTETVVGTFSASS
jgi:hypothetical protein